MKDTLSTIVQNERISGSYCRAVLKTGWRNYAPGQFVMIKTPAGFIRRPFGIARLKNGNVEICYKVIGDGTISLSSLKAGERLKVLGPIGNGFKISGQRTADRGRGALLVAGGYGVAPLLGLAAAIKNKKNVHLFYGAKTKRDLLYIKEFKKMGACLHIATEDGSTGEKGLITNTLKKFLSVTCHLSPVTIYTCGPNEMLKAIKSLLSHRRTIEPSHEIDCQLSLEAYMGCGMGVCLGCVVKNFDGEYVRVCKEGPVFKAEDIEL